MVGITAAMVTEAQNIGFAVPIRLAAAIIPELVAHGHLSRPWLGVQGQVVMPILKDLLRIPLSDGLLVEAVDPGSPADHDRLRGGSSELSIEGHPILLGGGIITAVNGSRPDSPDPLEAIRGTIKVGSTLHLTLLRGGQERAQAVTVTERPDPVGRRRIGRAAAVTPLNMKAVPGPASSSRLEHRDRPAERGASRAYPCAAPAAGCGT